MSVVGCHACAMIRQEIERAAREGTQLDRDIIGRVYRIHMTRDHGLPVASL